MPTCKFRCFFKSASFLTKNVSEESTDSGENGKQTICVITYQFNDNTTRLFPCLVIILSLPTAKHRHSQSHGV